MPTKKPKREVNQREFADIAGISQPRVCKLISDGKLGKAVRREGRRTFIDPDLALEILAGTLDPMNPAKTKVVVNTEPTADSASSDPPADESEKKTYQAYRTKSERYRALQRELDYLKSRRKLIELEAVRDACFQAARICRDHVLNITPRLAPIVAVETDEGKIAAMLRRELADALSTLETALRKAAK